MINPDTVEEVFILTKTQLGALGRNATLHGIRMEDVPKLNLNRVEVIDHRKKYADTDQGGRTVVLAGPAYGDTDKATVGISVQDDNKTLKIFIRDADEQE